MEFEVKELVVVEIACTSEVKSGERITFICDDKKFSRIVPPLKQGQLFFSYEIDQHIFDEAQEEMETTFDNAQDMETECPIVNQSDFICLEQSVSVSRKRQRIFLQRKIGKKCWSCKIKNSNKECPQLLCSVCCKRMENMKKICRWHHHKKKVKVQTLSKLSKTDPPRNLVKNFRKIEFGNLGKESFHTTTTKRARCNRSQDDTMPCPLVLDIDFT